MQKLHIQKFRLMGVTHRIQRKKTDAAALPGLKDGEEEDVKALLTTKMI